MLTMSPESPTSQPPGGGVPDVLQPTAARATNSNATWVRIESSVVMLPPIEEGSGHMSHIECKGVFSWQDPRQGRDHDVGAIDGVLRLGEDLRGGHPVD